MFGARVSLEVRKASRLRQLDEELQGLYMVGAICTSDAVLERVTRQVMQVEHNMARVRRVGCAVASSQPKAVGAVDSLRCFFRQLWHRLSGQSGN